MAAAPVLMWHAERVGTGALLFHAGLFLFVESSWRPTAAWLAAWSGAGPR